MLLTRQTCRGSLLGAWMINNWGQSTFTCRTCHRRGMTYKCFWFLGSHELGNQKQKRDSKMGFLSHFLSWAWARHPNVLSRYLRPMFILPLIYFACKYSR